MSLIILLKPAKSYKHLDLVNLSAVTSHHERVSLYSLRLQSKSGGLRDESRRHVRGAQRSRTKG